jgi:NAD-dependent dihydropyrimidine dehydrogenase PreA subunit
MSAPLPKPAKRQPKARKPLRRTSRPRPVRKSASAAMERKAGRLWSLLVLSRAPVCERCGVERPVHAHHLISRRYRSTRYVLHNGAALCAACHRLCHRGVGYVLRNERLAIRLVGVVGWDVLGAQAESTPRYTPEAELERLRAEVAARWLQPLAAGLLEGK